MKSNVFHSEIIDFLFEASRSINYLGDKYLVPHNFKGSFITRRQIYVYFAELEVAEIKKSVHALRGTVLVIPGWKPYRSISMLVIPGCKPYRSISMLVIPGWKPYRSISMLVIPGWKPYRSISMLVSNFKQYFV